MLMSSYSVWTACWKIDNRRMCQEIPKSWADTLCHCYSHNANCHRAASGSHLVSYWAADTLEDPWRHWNNFAYSKTSCILSYYGIVYKLYAVLLDARSRIAIGYPYLPTWFCLVARQDPYPPTRFCIGMLDSYSHICPCIGIQVQYLQTRLWINIQTFKWYPHLPNDALKKACMGTLDRFYTGSYGAHPTSENNLRC